MTTLAVALLTGALAHQTTLDCNTDLDCTPDGHCFEGKCVFDDTRRIVGVIPALVKGAVLGAAVAGVVGPRDDRDDHRYYAPRPYEPLPYYPAPGPSYYPSLEPLSDVGSENWGCQSNDQCPDGANCYLGINGGSNYCQFGAPHGTLCDDESDCAGNQYCQYGVCMTRQTPPLLGGRRLEGSETEQKAVPAEEGEHVSTCFFHGERLREGQTVPAGDDCNTCTCHDGTMSCTENPCPAPGPEGSEVANTRRILPIVGPIATIGALGLGALGGAALVDVARNGATDDDSYEPYYAPRYNQPRQQPYYQPRQQPYYWNGVGSSNGGCQSAHDCPPGNHCYLGSDGSPNFCGSIGDGTGSLCVDDSSCPGYTSCQHGVCRAFGRRLENEVELEGELVAPEGDARRIGEGMPWGLAKFFNQFNPYKTGNDWACPSSLPTGGSCRSDQAGKSCYYNEGVAYCDGMGLTGQLGTWHIEYTLSS